MTLDLMIDLETMGTRSDSVICSIGAVFFDPNGDTIDDEFYRTVDIQSCLDLGLTVTGDTIYWWLNQSDAARKAQVPKLGIHEALEDLNLWVAEHNVEDLKVWANGPDFDLVLIQTAYRLCNLKNRLIYWNYRDVRTLRDIAFPNSRVVPGVPSYFKHNALNDASNQAIGVQICMRKLASSVAQ